MGHCNIREGTVVECSGVGGLGTSYVTFLRGEFFASELNVGAVGDVGILIVKGVHPPWAVQRVRLGGQASTIQGVIQPQECSQASWRAAPV